MYALIGLEEPKKESDGKFEFRPLGCGVQDFPGILAAAETAGTKWVVVEQDEPSMGLSPAECAEKSIAYLKSIR
jgi:sugar phosphate isomerase/epimerase